MYQYFKRVNDKRRKWKIIEKLFNVTMKKYNYVIFYFYVPWTITFNHRMAHFFPVVAPAFLVFCLSFYFLLLLYSFGQPTTVTTITMKRHDKVTDEEMYQNLIASCEGQGET